MIHIEIWGQTHYSERAPPAGTDMPKFINHPTFQAIVSAFWLAFLAILGVNLINNFVQTLQGRPN